MSQTRDETILWESFLNGDNHSLEVIYRIYFDELYRYGMKWLKDGHLVEDVIQDLFVRLIQSRGNLAVAQSVKFYLFRAFKNMALDKIRFAKRMVAGNEPSSDTFQLDLTPESTMIDKEEYLIIRNKIENALVQLTPRQREALYLRYIEEFSYSEVSEMMGLTAKGTYKLMSRAIEAIRGQLPAGIFIFLSNHFLRLHPY